MIILRMIQDMTRRPWLVTDDESLWTIAPEDYGGDQITHLPECSFHILLVFAHYPEEHLVVLKECSCWKCQRCGPRLKAKYEEHMHAITETEDGTLVAGSTCRKDHGAPLLINPGQDRLLEQS